MYLGEYRLLEVTLSSKDRSDFLIRQASYTLTLNQEVVESGDCQLEDKTLRVYLDPKERGFHLLEYTIFIGDEIVKKRVHIQVL